MLAWGDWFGPAALAAGLVLWAVRPVEAKRIASGARSEPAACEGERSSSGSRRGARPASSRAKRAGHYESWFQRANHPSRPLAFWIRYTIFCPARPPGGCRGRAVGDRVRRRGGADHRGEAGAPDRGVPLLGVAGSTCASGRRSSRALARRGRPPRARTASAGSSRSAAASGRCCCFRARCMRAGFPRAKALVPAPERRLRRLARDRRRAPRDRRLARQPEPQLGQPPHRSLRLGPGRGLRRRPGRLPGMLDRARADRPAVDAVAHARWCCASTGASWRSTACCARCAPRARIDGFDWSFDTRAPGRARARPDRGAAPRASWLCATAILPAARRSASTASSRAASSRARGGGPAPARACAPRTAPPSRS